MLVVLEIAENGSLLDFLKKSRGTDQNYSSGLSEEMKLRIATDVAKGMAHLASCRVSIDFRILSLSLELLLPPLASPSPHNRGSILPPSSSLLSLSLFAQIESHLEDSDVTPHVCCCFSKLPSLHCYFQIWPSPILYFFDTTRSHKNKRH